MANSNSSKVVTIKPGIKPPARLPGTFDGGFAPRTPSIKRPGVDTGKGFAPKTPNTKGAGSGKK